MPNTYFQRQPLDESIKTIASGCKSCWICITYHSESVGGNPFYSEDILYTSNDLTEFTQQLRNAYALAKRHGGEKCLNEDIPKFENLIESKTDKYTIFIKYK